MSLEVGLIIVLLMIIVWMSCYKVDEKMKKERLLSTKTTLPRPLPELEDDLAANMHRLKELPRNPPGGHLLREKRTYAPVLFSAPTSLKHLAHVDNKYNKYL